jgi:hypothetical protein
MIEVEKYLAEICWLKLKASFSNILLNPSIEKESYMSAFDDSSTLIESGQFRVIYDGLRKLLEEHLQTMV